jgi:hypothetical protein
MIRINLLPPSQRVGSGHRLVGRIPFRALAIGAGFFWMGMTLGLLAVNGMQSQALAQWNKRWREIQPKKAQWEDLQQAVQMLRQQAKTLQTIRSDRARWSYRLNLLSDSLTSQLWFRSLSWKDGERAVLKGRALVGSRQPEAETNVARFLKRMKDHPKFSEAFRTVELRSVAQQQVAGEAVVDFEIWLIPSSG